MLLALISIAATAACMIVVTAITTSAIDSQKQSNDSGTPDKDRGNGRDDDESREQEAQKKIAKANAQKKHSEDEIVQNISPLPVVETDRDKDIKPSSTIDFSTKSKSLDNVQKAR